MANPGHVRLLKQGADIWNTWRLAHPKIEPNLSEADLKGIKVKGADFHGVDIRSTDLSDAELLDCDFTDTKAGLSPKYKIGFTTICLLLTAFTGFASGFIGYIIASPFDPSILAKILSFLPNTPLLEPKWAALASVTVVASCLLYFRETFREGLWSGVRLLSVVFSIVAAFTFLGAIAEDFASVGIVAFAVAIIGIMSFAFAVLFACLAALTFRLAPLFSGFLASVIAFVAAIIAAGDGTSFLAISVAGISDVIFIFSNIIISYRALSEDERYALIRKVSIVLVSRLGTSFRSANLSQSNFLKANFSNVDLSFAILNRTNLNQVTGLNLARVDETILIDVSVRELVSTFEANERDYSGVSLKGANLSGARGLRKISLAGANINEATFENASLEGADLSEAQAIGTNFSGSNLTGACLSNLNIDERTTFKDVVCHYVFLQPGYEARRPRQDEFKAGEFEALFQKVVDTVDLIFVDGIDWQAFFASFQDLRRQYSDQEISIQAIEKKRDGAFIVRIEVPPEADKLAIESDAKQSYEKRLKTLKAKYENQLRLRGKQHSEEINRLIDADRQERSSLIQVIKTMANQPPKYDFRNAQFGGGFIETNYGAQYGGIINNYGSNNAEDITRILAALRDQVQTFPTDQKDDANDVLDDLERDLAEEQPDQGRIGRRLKRLIAIATTLTIGATAFTADLAQLADVLNVPLPQIEQVKPEQLPPSD